MKHTLLEDLQCKKEQILVEMNEYSIDKSSYYEILKFQLSEINNKIRNINKPH